MSDSFLDPTTQAKLDALSAQLSRLTTEVTAAQKGVTELRSAVDKAKVDAQRVTRGVGAGTGGAASTEAKASEALAAGEHRATAATDELATSQARLRTQLEETTAQYLKYDTAVSSSGALSAASLQAVGRGTLTLREMGNQVTQTIGKFAGWTGAAAAVYGALGAISELKTGAVDASSAVTALGRFLPKESFNPDKARDQLVSQAQQTATPIKDVGDASQQFAKVFKDQSDVFTATHVSLTASKLDNISLADSYKYLTALVQEWGVSAQALPGIFDQVTAAQDKLGAKVSIILPALARSLSGVKNAGGDLSQLVGLESLAAVRSGATGEVIGTAFSTGSARFYNQASSRATRERLGINPDLGYTQGLVEAIKKGPSLSDGDKRQLVQAFFGLGGGRGGGRIAGIFNAGPDQLNKFLGETASGAHPGLADTQLNKAMQQADNQIKELKVNLQSIGAELGGSGLSTPLGVLLQGLNGILHATTEILKAWNGLPGPLKEAASILGTLVGTTALLRRFDVGGTVGGPLAQGLIGRRPETQARLDAKNITKSIEEQYQGAIAASTLQARTHSFNANDTTLNAETRSAAARDAVIAQTRTEGLIAGLGSYRAAGGTAATDVASTAEKASADRLAAREVLGLGSGLSGLNTKVSEFASVLASNAIPALLGMYAVYQTIKTAIGNENKKLDTGRKGIENARTPAEVDKALSGENDFKASDLLPWNAVGRVHQILGGNQTANEQQGDARKRELASDQTSNQAIQRRVQDFLNKGNAQGAFQAFRNDAGLKDQNPDAYNAEFNDLYKHAEKAKLRLKPGQVDPFADVRAASDDLKNKLDPLIQSLGNAGKVFGTTQEILGKEAADYAYAVNKLGGNPKDPQAMQALVSAQTALVSDTSKRVQSLLDLGKSQTTNAGAEKFYSQAAQVVPQAQAKIRQYFAQIEKGASPDQIKRDQQAMQEILGLVAKERQAAISALLAQLKSETDVKVSSIPGIGPQADLARAQATLSGLQGELTKAKASGADSQTINTLIASINNQQRTILQQRVSNAEALIQAQSQYAQSGTTDPVQQASIELSYINKEITALAALGQNAQSNPTLILPLLAQARQDAVKQVDAQLAQWQAQQQIALAQSNVGQGQATRLQNNIATAQSLVSHLQSLGSKVSPLKLLEAQKALIDAQSALVDYQIQEGRSLIDAQTALKQSKTFDAVAIAKDALSGAKSLLGYDTGHHASPSTLLQDQAKIGDARKNVLSAQWAQLDATIQFQASTYQITQAEELSRLQKLLADEKKNHASVSQLQQTRKEIYDLQFNQSGDLNLNVGNLKLPSTYEVRSAIRAGHTGARTKTTAGLLADVKTNVNMQVHISRDVDMKKFTDALNEALGTSTQGIAQAAGLI